MVICLLGSEGKLSVIDQRMGMLAGIGNLSYNTVSGTQSVQSLSDDVATEFIKTLQTEGEGSHTVSICIPST